MKKDSYDILFGNKADFYRRYYRKLTEENEKFNLTSVTEENEVLYKHFIDSKDAASLFDKNASVAEIGSGAGFPSVPLKIERPDLKLTLIESNNKKANFLNEVKTMLQFENFTVICDRAENIAKGELRESFDYAIARAVAKCNTLLEYSLPLVKEGGSVILWKGQSLSEELKQAQNAMKILGGSLEKIISYEIGDYGSHYYCIIKKVKKTPLKYPRGNGKERKCPL